MQTTNATYKNIVAGRYSVEYKAVIAGHTYNQSEIVVSGGYPTETAALFEKFGIGNAVAGSLDIWLVPYGTIPPMERIELYFRVKNASLTSNWYPKGKYYIDTRQTDSKTGIIHFTAYDQMLMTEYVFMESGTWTSCDAETTVDMICTDIGISLNGSTRAILQADPQTIPYVPVIGPDGTTARQMLEWIGVLYGGNWIVDELGELKLIQVKLNSGNNKFNINVNYIEQGSIASATGTDTSGTTRLRTYGYIPVEPSTEYTISCGINRVFIIQYPNASISGYVNRSSGWQSGSGYTFTTHSSTHYLRMTFSVNDSTTVTPSDLSWVMLNEGGSALPYEPYNSGIDLGKQMVSLDLSPAFSAIDRVIIRSGNEDGVGYRSPDVSDYAWSQMTGRVLRAACPWTTQAVADAVLAVVTGVAYQPFEANGANLDPSAQLGDVITLNGTTSVLCAETLHLDARCAADISAPYDEEVDHEYPYRSPAQRKLDNTASQQDIDGMVTHDELQTAGQTSINGSNIHSGTIVLGGAGNGNGQMELVDENDVMFGKWDKDRVTIYDDTASDSVLKNAKFAVIRQGAPDNTEFGVFIGDTQILNAFFPGTYPDEAVPFLYLNGTTDGVTSDGKVFITPNPSVMSPTFTKTNNSSTANYSSSTVKKWGRYVQMTVHLTNVSYANAGDVLWEGKISNTSLILPVDQATGCGANGANNCFGIIEESSGDILLRIYAGSGGYQANWTANLSFTYLT